MIWLVKEGGVAIRPDEYFCIARNNCSSKYTITHTHPALPGIIWQLIRPAAVRLLCRVSSITAKHHNKNNKSHLENSVLKTRRDRKRERECILMGAETRTGMGMAGRGKGNGIYFQLPWGAWHWAADIQAQKGHFLKKACYCWSLEIHSFL
jgi:hypothetical protein